MDSSAIIAHVSDYNDARPYQLLCHLPASSPDLACRNIMSNNTAFGTAQPPKKPAAHAPSSADGLKEGSAAPVDPEWEAARCFLPS